jgi:hypothetical protein
MKRQRTPGGAGMIVHHCLRPWADRLAGLIQAKQVKRGVIGLPEYLFKLDSVRGDLRQQPGVDADRDTK